MDDRNLKNQYEVEQYQKQANLVYTSTIFICTFLGLVFIFIIPNLLITMFNLIGIIVSFVSIRLNRNQLYGQSSFVYISYIAIITFMEVLIFGSGEGFQYYYFTLAGLVMYTNWKEPHKWLGVATIGLMAIISYFLTFKQAPNQELGYPAALFFHSLNVVLNIFGIANSANYYIKVATKYQGRFLNMAFKDYLTNLMNRTAFDRSIDQILTSKFRNHQDVGLLILDIDHFKHVNDTYGHLTGDEILRQFAKVLKAITRHNDFVARYGGEEFVIISPVVDVIQLENLAERIVSQVANHDFVVNDKTLKITVSSGGVFIPWQTPINKETAISMADELLYQAKSTGRNKTVINQVK